MGTVHLKFCSFLLFAINGALPLFSQAPANPAYAGSNACRTCHPNVALQFFRNPHNKSTVSSNVVIENAGCEGCHGPGKKHVDARGGKQSIVAFSALTASQVVDACLRCHAKDTNRANIRRSNMPNRPDVSPLPGTSVSTRCTTTASSFGNTTM